jgi:hypothetical protein
MRLRRVGALSATKGAREGLSREKRKSGKAAPLNKAPRKCRQAGFLNLRFKVVAFRAHQALPGRTRTTALLWAATRLTTLVHRIYSLDKHRRGNFDLCGYETCTSAGASRPADVT